ncbi:MAG: SsrA-binding protein SmpB [Gammaproteobacteria bacterium]|nr:SsrA-binding protein SmpB [Gammaproteobacteria bacterium]
MANKKKNRPAGNSIAQNKKARHDYFVEDTYEAGLVLEGWEVKSLRAGRVQLNEGFVVIHKNEAWLHGCLITPLLSASTHIRPESRRNRKLLLNRRELDKLIGAVDRKGYTLVPLDMHWKKGRAKLTVGLAKGKKEYDKRATARDRDWARDKQRILKRG